MRQLLALAVLCFALKTSAVPILNVDYFQVDGRLYISLSASDQPADMTFIDFYLDDVRQFGKAEPFPTTPTLFTTPLIIGFYATTLGIHTYRADYTTPGGIVSASDTYEVFDPSYNTPGAVAPVPDTGGTLWLMCAGLVLLAFHGLFPMAASSTKT